MPIATITISIGVTMRLPSTRTIEPAPWYSGGRPARPAAPAAAAMFSENSSRRARPCRARLTAVTISNAAKR